ncbi:hypothetical protein, partial [Enhygromyxa salina]|uniref:hypothetical protein n=1 Tax=Enhygromyxa salina TaxID=215803 RepID=UPI001C635583
TTTTTTTTTTEVTMNDKRREIRILAEQVTAHSLSEPRSSSGERGNSGAHRHNATEPTLLSDMLSATWDSVCKPHVASPSSKTPATT